MPEQFLTFDWLPQVLSSVYQDRLIVAFHMLKHNDQRRLDPIGIIKTLAFQIGKRYICGQSVDVLPPSVLSSDDKWYKFTTHS